MVAIDNDRRRIGASSPLGGAHADTTSVDLSLRRLKTGVLAYMLAMIPPVGFGVAGIELGPVRLVLLVLTPILILQLFSGKFGRLRAPDFLMFGFLIWQAISIWSWHGTVAIQYVGSVGVEMIGGYMVGRAYLRCVEDFERLSKLFGILVLITVPFAAIEALTGQRLVLDFFAKIPGVSAYTLSTAEERLGMSRAQVNFKHTIHYGIFCAMAFSTSVLVTGPYRAGIGKFLSPMLIGLGSFFSLSSGGFLVFLIQLGAIIWRWIMLRTGRPWLIFGIIFAVMYGVIEVLSDRSAFMVLLTMATFSAYNAYWRVLLFEYSMDNVWANPIFGIGLNDWVRPSWIFSSSLDNFFAVVVMTYGIPAFLMMSLAMLLPLFRAMRMRIENNPRLMRCRAAWVLTIIAMILALCTVYVWGKVYSLVFFMIGSGIWFLDEADRIKAGEPTTVDGKTPIGEARGPAMAPLPRRAYSRKALKPVPLEPAAEAPPASQKDDPQEKMGHSRSQRAKPRLRR